MIIAIDGPSGSGKSTIAKAIAKKLNLLHLDTGAMYRLLALHLKRKNMEFSSEAIKDFKINQENDKYYLNGEDVSKEIRDESISKLASDISKIKELREYMVEMQREISKSKSVILDGRDIGTVVFPDADFKFFLTASPEVRAKRRLEQIGFGDFDTILAEINKRDEQDSTRENSPLKKADDAVLIDSSKLSIDRVQEIILSFVVGYIHA